MFTDRFIELPIKIFDENYKGMTGKEVLEDSWTKVNPMEISHYKPAYDDEDKGDNFNCTHVSMKNGDAFFIYLLPKDFEKILNAWNKT